MKTILDTIIENKKVEVLKRKAQKPLEDLKASAYYNREAINPVPLFQGAKPGIIAEFKRRSPSKGQISDLLNPLAVVNAYKKAGAVMSSILTDRKFFAGSFKDLSKVRQGIGEFPLLRKDFMIDPYQVHEAKSYGADVILLIAAALEKHEIQNLASEAASLGLSVLFEVHNEEELDLWVPDISMVGVNNRNLKDFTVDIERSIKLAPLLPSEVVKISESGLKGAKEIRTLFEAGYQGFLMGEHLMKQEDKGAVLREILQEFNKV